jgi:hypothetical protein
MYERVLSQVANVILFFHTQVCSLQIANHPREQNTRKHQLFVLFCFTSGGKRTPPPSQHASDSSACRFGYATKSRAWKAASPIPTSSAYMYSNEIQLNDWRFWVFCSRGWFAFRRLPTPLLYARLLLAVCRYFPRLPSLSGHQHMCTRFTRSYLYNRNIYLTISLFSWLDISSSPLPFFI